MQNDTRKAFEKWVKTVNHAEIKWIGHSYANAYMAAQYEGWQESRSDLLERLKSEKMVEKVAIILENSHIANSFRDDAKAALAAIIEEIRG